MRNDPPILVARELSVHAGAVSGRRALIERISFEVGRERVALVGESGSGKSLTSRALLGLLPRGLSAQAAELTFRGTDLLSLQEPQWRNLRGGDLALALQDPRRALNPVLRVGRQLDEMLRLHGVYARAERRERVESALQAVGLSSAVLASYPLELSGGMGQRVVLAMMLLNGPQLLIADEPTSALDEHARDQVLELICRLVNERGMGLLLISHDLQQVARSCDRALIMYRGRIVDACPAAMLAHSAHPYTRALWDCRPSGRTYGHTLPVFASSPQAQEVSP